MTLTANPFTYRAFDVITMAELDALPYQNVSFARQLNHAGPWRGQLALADPHVNQFNWERAASPSNTMLVVDFLGAAVWGGIIWTSHYEDSDPQHLLKVGASEFGSYFQQRRQAQDYTNTFHDGQDPMLIATRVIEDAQTLGSVAGGIQLILHPAGGSGQVSSPSYPGTAVQTIDSIVQILSQMGYTFGFDYSFDVIYLPGTRTPAVQMNLWYPRQGREQQDSGIVVLYKDTVAFTYPVDGSQQAISVTETAAGRVLPATETAEGLPYPLLERPFSRTQVLDSDTLANIALGDLAQYCWPVVTPTIKLPISLPDAQGNVAPGSLAFHDFQLGDDLQFRIDPVAGGGENVCPRFRGGMRFDWRITNWTATPKDSGLSTLLFDLSIPPLSVIPPPQPPP